MAKRAYSPRDIAAKTYVTIPWGEKWSKVFGYPSITETWFVSGSSASGKSSFVMQLAKELCSYGSVLYLSYEEGVSKSFQDRIKRKSAKFVIIDSFQYSNWSYEQAKTLADDFPRKCFIFISQEYKGQPLGKPAARLKYMAGMKVRVQGYKAYCQGRAIGEAGEAFTVWEDGVIQTSNEA